jgi:hypothetical protein
MSMYSFATSSIVVVCLALQSAHPVVAEDYLLFNFAESSGVHDWVPVKLTPEPTDVIVDRKLTIKVINGKAIQHQEALRFEAGEAQG